MDYDMDVVIYVKVKDDNGDVQEVELTTRHIKDNTLDLIFQDVDEALEKEFKTNL